MNFRRSGMNVGKQIKRLLELPWKDTMVALIGAMAMNTGKVEALTLNKFYVKTNWMWQ